MRMISLLLLSILVGCNDSGPSVGAEITPAQKAAAAETMRVTFPDAADFLYYEETAALIDPILRVKIALPAAALPEFLDQPVFADAEWRSDDHPFQYSDTGAVWQPSSVNRFRFAIVSLTQGQYLSVLVDESGEGQAIMYLEWYQH